MACAVPTFSLSVRQTVQCNFDHFSCKGKHSASPHWLGPKSGATLSLQQPPASPASQLIHCRATKNSTNGHRDLVRAFAGVARCICPHAADESESESV